VGTAVHRPIREVLQVGNLPVNDIRGLGVGLEVLHHVAQHVIERYHFAIEVRLVEPSFLALVMPKAPWSRLLVQLAVTSRDPALPAIGVAGHSHIVGNQISTIDVANGGCPGLGLCLVLLGYAMGCLRSNFTFRH